MYKLIYEMLIENKTILTKVSTKLREKFDIEIDEQEVRNAFKVKSFTKIAKYVSFQYRFLHCAILLNDRLFHMGMVKAQTCTLCGKYKETYRHFFYDCTITKKMYEEIIKYYAIPRWNLTLKKIILNNVSADLYHSTNLILLVTKQILYRCRCAKTKPNINLVINEIEFIQRIEKMQMFTNKQKKQYQKRWNTVG